MSQGRREVLSDPLIFLHGLMGSSQGFKATLLRDLYPHILIPDFRGSLEERMAQLTPILADEPEWVIIGSSMGGLMGALFTCQHPERVGKLILLAPALTWPDFFENPPAPVSVPTVVYHGRRDTVVPVEPVRDLAARIFTDLTFYVVDDDHGLHRAVQAIDWSSLLQFPREETR
jgi:pimeloyl-ACP methyl ester carboxylesterase